MRSSGWQMKAVTICRICTKETCGKLENSRKIFPYFVTLALFSFIHSFNHWANIGGSMSDRDKSLWVTCASLKTLQSCLSHSPSPPFPSKRLRHTRWSGTTQEPAAAAAKSLQSCPTLGDPMDCSPPGSSIHGIFQARVLEWGAIAFSDAGAYERVNIFKGKKGRLLLVKERSLGSTKEIPTVALWTNPLVRCITLQLWPVTDLQNNYPDL